jgi:hypothetical protein
MSLKERLMDDLKSAMKAKDKLRKDTVTMLRSAIKQVEVDERRELTDEDVIDIIASQIKQKNNAITDFKAGGRADLVEQTETEIALLQDYLPEQLSEEALIALIQEAISKTGAASVKDMGKVMGMVTAEAKGRADNKRIADLVKKALA